MHKLQAEGVETTNL